MLLHWLLLPGDRMAGRTWNSCARCSWSRSKTTPTRRSSEPNEAADNARKRSASAGSRPRSPCRAANERRGSSNDKTEESYRALDLEPARPAGPPERNNPVCKRLRMMRDRSRRDPRAVSSIFCNKSGGIRTDIRGPTPVGLGPVRFAVRSIVVRLF